MGRQEKLIVTFDEKDRKDFVTGFRKRKQARRKAAEHQRKQLEKDAKREARAERKKALEEACGGEGETLTTIESIPIETKSDAYQDDFSKKAFGAGSVVVSTTLGLPSDDEEDEKLESFLASRAKRQRLLEEASGSEKEERKPTAARHPSVKSSSKPKMKEGFKPRKSQFKKNR